MRKFLICTAAVLAIVGVFIYYYPSVQVIRAVQDERGLISVEYKFGVDTFAYDYLTPGQYDNLIQNADPYNYDTGSEQVN